MNEPLTLKKIKNPLDLRVDNVSSKETDFSFCWKSDVLSAKNWLFEKRMGVDKNKMVDFEGNEYVILKKKDFDEAFDIGEE